MKTENTRRGFTLIELLVVVLIIGILAAVAVPQYQKAVAKTRMMEAMTNLSAIGRAHQVCFLGKGETCAFDDIDIELEGEVRNGGMDLITDKFHYQIETQDVAGNKLWAFVISREEDVCMCYLQDGEIVVSQNADGCSANEARFDYATLLNLRDASDEDCECC